MKSVGDAVLFSAPTAPCNNSWASGASRCRYRHNQWAITSVEPRSRPARHYHRREYVATAEMSAGIAAA